MKNLRKKRSISKSMMKVKRTRTEIAYINCSIKSNKYNEMHWYCLLGGRQWCQGCMQIFFEKRVCDLENKALQEKLTTDLGTLQVESGASLQKLCKNVYLFKKNQPNLDTSEIANYINIYI